MIWLLLLIPIAIVLTGTIVNVRELPRRRYARCLRNIERLERELGIGVPVISPKTDWLVVDEEFRIEPGVRWPVESNNHVQIISTAWEL